MDFATSTDPHVQRQLDRLAALSPGADLLGLERIGRLCARLNHPERALPPVFHVAGTNGKGSTCAFLRAALEASGRKVHAYTSPHLVRFNERIRLAGRLVDDEELAALLDEVLGHAHGIGPSFFEVTTAAAVLAFARHPADACVIEVGLGGRLDATNVLPAPAACGIAQLGLDHQAFLGDSMEGIAAEKAGIAKPGTPLVTGRYPPSQAARVEAAAAAAGAPWFPRGWEWDWSVGGGRLGMRDAAGTLDLPLPRLPGAHQAGNAALAVAMLRHQQTVPVGLPALRAAMGWAEWPARLQRIAAGPLPALLPAGGALWLDGGHNPAAARAIAAFCREAVAPGRPFHLVLGMLANKDLPGFLEPFAGSDATVTGVPVPGHAHHAPDAIAFAARDAGLRAATADDPVAALARIGQGADRVAPFVLVGGSLYLAGGVLDANGTPPG
jgi:dihydrofolate synthase/folylpolyglutamate synthase